METFFVELPLLLNIVLVAVALWIVTRAAHYLIDGAVHLAHEFKISPLVIGATVIAVGTSSAELAINMAVVLGKGDTSAVVGNILGSNLVNFGIGLGLPALIAGMIVVPQDAFERDIPLYLAATGLLTAFVHDDMISRLEAGIMLVMFIVAIGLIVQYATTKSARRSILLVEVTEVEAISHPSAHALSRRGALIALFGGLTVLVVASRLLIFNTAAVAEELRIPEFVIGLVIVGPGTSLPEIASAIQAVRQKHADLVIGMAFGSNLFNLLFGLGLPALFQPLIIEETAVLSFTFMDIINLSLAAVLLLDFEWLGRARTINWAVGLGLLGSYVGFIAYEVVKAAGGSSVEWALACGLMVLASVILWRGMQWRAERQAALIQRERAAGVRPPAKPRILCATRGGEASQPTHERAIEIARERDAELIFLYVFDRRLLQRVATPIVFNVSAQVEHMLAYLEATAQAQAYQAGVEARVIVRTGELREQLVTVAGEEHVTLILFGSPHGEASQFQRDSFYRFARDIAGETGVDVLAVDADPVTDLDTDITDAAAER